LKLLLQGVQSKIGGREGQVLHGVVRKLDDAKRARHGKEGEQHQGSEHRSSVTCIAFITTFLVICKHTRNGMSD
jgi:hypothetical protein